MKLSRRETECIKLLINSNSIINSSSISEKLKVSDRTIRNNIKLINKYLQKYKSEIVSYKGKGYKGVFSNEFLDIFKGLKNIDVTDNKDRIEYLERLLFKNLLDSKEITFESLINRFYVSESTLNNLLKDFNTKLSKYCLDVKFQKGILKVRGNSNNLRNFMVNYYCKYYLDDIEVQKIKLIVVSVLKEFNLSITDEFVDKLSVQIYFSYKVKIMNMDNSNLNDLENLFEFEVIEKIIAGLGYKINIDEKRYLTSYLLACGKFFELRENDYLERWISTLLNEIDEKFNSNFSLDNILKNSVIVHLSSLINRVKYKIDIDNDHIKSIKKLYPRAFDIAIYTAMHLEKVLLSEISENEIGFFAMHYAAAFEREKRENNKKLKAIVVCGGGLATSLLLQEIIKNEMGEKIEFVGRYALYEINDVDLKNIDIIISTIRSSKLELSKTVFIEKFISKYDLEKIKMFIKSNEKSLSINIRDYIKKEIFITEMDVKNKFEALENLTNNMITHNYMTNLEKESVFKRESIASTELGNLLAMPHIVKGDSDNNFISIAILRKPILWNFEKVQLIILLNINNSKSKEWEFIFKKIYKNFIQDTKSIEMLKRMTYEKFIECFNEVK